jgi:hypothetical protein
MVNSTTRPLVVCVGAGRGGGREGDGEGEGVAVSLAELQAKSKTRKLELMRISDEYFVRIFPPYLNGNLSLPPWQATNRVTDSTRKVINVTRALTFCSSKNRI